MKLLGQQSILSGSVSFRVPAGQYAGFSLRAAGTNQAAQTLTIANLGRITSTWRGGAFMGVTFSDMNVLDAQIGGVAESASAAGGAFTMSAFIPASYVGDGNIFDVADDDEMWITLDLSGVTAVIVASGTVSLFGLVADGAQAYLPRVFSSTRNLAASSIDAYQIPRDNFGAVFISTLTNIGSIQIERDGDTIVKGTPAELLSWANWMSRVETAVTTSLLIPVQVSRTIDEALSDSLIVSVESNAGGAATPSVVDISYDFTPDSLARSRAVLSNNVNQRTARKIGLRKARAVSVADEVRGGTK